MNGRLKEWLISLALLASCALIVVAQSTSTGGGGGSTTPVLPSGVTATSDARYLRKDASDSTTNTLTIATLSVTNGVSTLSSIRLKTATTTTNYAYGTRDYMVFANAANITNTLPLAAGCTGQVYACKLLVTNNVVIVPQPGDAIDWATSLTIGVKGVTEEFISDGTTNWFRK